MNKYKVVEKKGEGTFSEVVQVKHLHTGKYAAIKCMKAKYGNIDEVNDLREIQALRRLSPHPNIVQLYEVLFDRPTGRLALVFEIMDLNLYELIQHRQQRLPGRHVKIYMYQLFQALDFMHKKGIFHRDIKPENILINKSSKTLKLADLGSCRGIYSKPPFTEYISTRWYRAPECLLTSGGYGPEMDVWGAGCVHFEIMTLYPVFPGNDEIDQISRIHKVLGTPDHRFIQGLKTRGNSSSCDFIPRKGTGIAPLIPFATKSCIDFVTRALEYKKERRLIAEKAIVHPYFSDKKAKLTISLPQSYDDFASEKKPLHETVGYHSNSLPNIDTGQISNKSKSSSWTERRKVFETVSLRVWYYGAIICKLLFTCSYIQSRRYT